MFNCSCHNYFVVMADQFSGLDTRANHTSKIVHMLFCSDLQHTCCFAHKKDWYMWCNVTVIFTSLTVKTWWQQFFRWLSNCDAPSQLISLVLVTASLPLLGSDAASHLSPKAQDATYLTAERIGLLIGEHLRHRNIVIPLQASVQWLAANLE